MDLTSELSIEALAVVEQDSVFPFISKREGHLPCHWQFHTNAERTLSFWTYTGAWQGTNSSPGVFELGKLHAFAATYANGTLRFYVDGEQVSTATIASSLPAGTVPVRLGAIPDPTAGPYYFNGHLVEVRLWNRALSPEEIASNAYRVLHGDEPGLVALWRLNEEAGAIVADATGNEHTGTVYGATWGRTSKRQGARNVLLDLSGVGVASSSCIAWGASTPSGTGVTIETNLSLDGGSTWLGWKVCTNGGPIPDIGPGTNLTNARLKVWEHLHTTDPAVEPVLPSLVIVISGRQSTGRPRGRVVPAGSAGRVHPVAHEGRVHPWG